MRSTPPGSTPPSPTLPETRRLQHLRGRLGIPILVGWLLPLWLPLLLTACGEEHRPQGRISGRVLFEGEAPEAKALDLSPAPICASLHDVPVLDAKVRVGAEGGLAGAFVLLRNAPTDSAPPPPEEPVVLHQRGCRFEPRVLGVRAGQPLVVRNEDPTYHNVVAEPESNPGFDLSQPFEGMESRFVFEQPELMIPVRSEAHPWMEAWLCVVDHPWFAVTGDDGGFALEAVPPGDYVLEVWHEELGRREARVSVAPEQAARVEVTFPTPTSGI